MEDPQSPSHGPGPDLATETATTVTSKPIKKKAPIFSVEDDISEESPDEGTGGPPFSPPSTREMENKAKKELIHFLENKQIDPKYAEMYQIHISLQKKRKSGSGNDHNSKTGYSVTYSGADGSILTSKTDVLNSIMESRKRTQLSQSRAGASNDTQYARKRSEAHQQAKANLLEASADLPATFDGIKVLSFGTLDTRSGFETLTQLYPIGYKCEQTVNMTNFFKGPSSSYVVCEVGELEGFPEFRVTVKSSGDTFLASTEAAVWRKFNTANVESDWQPSFFNLQVELLLEGLQGAEMCDTYRFHVERGYGTQYFTQEDALSAKLAFIAKSGREKRNLERQKARLLTKEEVDRLQELENKRLADEKELAKRLSLVEKERKDAERDQIKRAKSEQKQLEAQRREESRMEENRRKEAHKSMDKAQRELSKKNEKYRAQFKREINNELRKNRAEANSALLSFFDAEEEVMEQKELGSVGSVGTVVVKDQSSGISEFIASLPSATVALEPTNTSHLSVAAASGTSLDDVIALTNTLHLFKRRLNIETPIKLDSIVNSIDLVSKAAEVRLKSTIPAPTTGAVDPNNSTAAPSDSAMEVDNTTSEVTTVVKKGSDDEDEAEFDEVHTTNTTAMNVENSNNTATEPTTTTAPVAVTPTTLLAAAEADLDKIQLKLLHHLIPQLRDVLDVEEVVDPNARPRNNNPSKGTPLKLPLNQLTFAELARMCILNHLYTEQGLDKDTIQHVLRGAKTPNFKLAKNVIRNIRYRIAVRTKLPVTVGTSVIASGAGASDVGNSNGVVDSKGETISFTGAVVPVENHLAAIVSLNASVSNTASTNSAPIDATTLRQYQSRIVYPKNMLFNTEREMVQAMETICASSDYSDTYKRCARILARLVTMAQSRNLLWEVDASAYPDYYQIIQRPVMYTNIAAALIDKSYSVDSSTSITDADNVVAALFSADTLQIPTNCIVYNSEVQGVVAQAQKMLLATHRLLYCWLHGTSTSIAQCTENFCLLTNEYISPTDSLKCGKCAGFYCYSATEDACTVNNSASAKGTAIYNAYNAYYIAPTQEIIDQQNEEWVCPLCLHEDSTVLHSVPASTLHTLYSSPYSIDEYGYSTRMPWMYNTDHSTMTNLLHNDSPYLLPFVNALKVLSQTNTSSVLPVAPGSTLLPNVRNAHKHATTTAITTSNSAVNATTWTFQDRVTVLLALCAVFRSTEKSMDFMQSINADCDKLVKLSAKPNFREADFMSVVKDLMGEEGVLQCRSLLDGPHGNNNSSEYLQQVISEGRCVVCNHSTFEEDIQEKNERSRQSQGAAGGCASSGNGEEETEAPSDEVILCDGCNAEVHLRCLHLTAVPTSEWHCAACTARLALRESKHSSVLVEGGGSIDKHRSKVVEEDLLNSCIDRRISMATSSSGKGSGKKDKDKDSNNEVSGSSLSLLAMEPAPGEEKCVYCGMGELELCSPFVVGQSREEHEAVLALAGKKPTADYIIDNNTTGTTVLFLNQGKTMAPPVVEFPFFPTLNSPRGEKFLEMHKECGGHCMPVVAHQLCALQIFQARVTRSRHTLRRRNKVIGQRAVSMTGISVLPLGYDDSGREYWKFPTSDDLFICVTSAADDNNSTRGAKVKHVDRCQAEFNALLNAERVSYNNTSESSMEVEGGVAAVDALNPTTATTTTATPVRVWKRLYEVTDIRRLVELLGASEGESALKKSIINALLLERSVTTTAADSEVKAESSESQEVTIIDNNNNAATSTANTNTMNSWLDRSRSSASLNNEKNPELTEENVNKTLKKGVDLVPTSMRLMTQKGQDIAPVYTIQNEVVFDEEATDPAEGDEEEEERVNEYFTFNKGRKYFAIALLNKEGSVLKMGGTAKQQNLTVVYQIHRDGISAPLSYAPLSEAWTDHMYYFSTVHFKRSGKYTISFIVEGDNAGSIKPLIFPIVVTSTSVRCGIPHAIDKLEGVSFLDALNRHALVGRREILNSIEQVHTELEAVRALLLILYLALPAGALNSDSSSAGATNASNGDSFALITEPAGWNDVLDQAWRGAVYNATTPLQLLECVLLLEYYINKQWLAYPQSRVLSALPNPHFAVCNATYSSAALRIYCLDKALLYEKVHFPPRERRAAQFDQYAYEEPATTKYSQSTANSNASAYDGRGRRAAAASASLRIQKSVNYNDDSEDDGPNVTTTSVQPPQKWACPECTMVNEARARSCAGCEARKPTAGSAAAVAAAREARGRESGDGGRSGRTSGRAAAAVASSRVKARFAESSDNEESDQSEESESDSSNKDEDSNDDEEGSDSDNSLVPSDEDSPRPAKKSYRESSGNSSSRRSSNASTGDSERKSGRARKAVDSYFHESESDEDNLVNTPTAGSNKRRRDGSLDHTDSSSKKARELSADEYSAIYRRELPAKIAQYATLIANTTDDSTIRYLSILRALHQDITTEVFWEPVDLKAVPSYKHYISKPMDLGTIRNKVVKGAYASAEQFAEDVRLVWSNCRTFNLEYSPLANVAIRLGVAFEQMFQKWVLSEDRPENPNIMH